MARTIVLEPITRIEGHGKVTLRLDDAGQVAEAWFSTAEFRGFEKFCEGRMLWDMPALTSRICGFCPTSHQLASVKACEDLLGVTPPRTAVMLRELLLMGQFIQSHALHFFFLALPDFLTRELQPDERHVFAMLDKTKNLATSAVRVRKVGQEIVDRIGGGRLHPVSVIPGGMSKPLGYADRVALLEKVSGGLRAAQSAVNIAKDLATKKKDLFTRFASFPSHYMGLVKDGALELYDGQVRVVDHTGAPRREFAPRDYLEHLEERSEAKSWTKGVYLRGAGGDGAYRVAPLARLNVAQSIATPLAAAEHQEWKQMAGAGVVQSSLHYHLARMIELLYCFERARDLLRAPEIMGTDVRVPVERREGEGVGVIEAPRGTLFHHYRANEDGRLVHVNLIVSTAHNKDAMNRAVTLAARGSVRDGELKETDAAAIEMAIRCYDPCLSCSTHEYGRMPLELVLEAPDGTEISRLQRGL